MLSIGVFEYNQPNSRLMLLKWGSTNYFLAMGASDRPLHVESLRTAVTRIVDSADLESATLGTIVKELRLEYGESVDDMASTVKELVDEALVVRVAREAECAHSPDDVVGAKHESIAMQSDEQIARQLQAQEVSQMRSTRQVRKSVSRSEDCAKKQAKADKGAKDNPFNRPQAISPPLARLLGVDPSEHMSRPQVVKRIWAYVKEHNLQDAKNKRFFKCDSLMEDVFKRKKVECFAMNRYLSNHLFAPDEIVSHASSDLSVKQKDRANVKTKANITRPSETSHANDAMALNLDDILAWESQERWYIPSSLSFLLSVIESLKRPLSMNEVIDAGFSYVSSKQLFVPNESGSILLNNELQMAFDCDMQSLSILDFINALRRCVTENQ